MQLHFKHDVFAGQIFHVILGEGDVDILLLADLHADDLLLKAGNKGTGTELKGVALGLAAVKTLAVEEAVKVDLRSVAHLSLAVVHADLAGIALANAFQLFVHVLVADGDDGLDSLKALVLAERHLGIKIHTEGISGSAVVGHFHVGDAGSTDNAELVFGHAELIGLGGKLVQRVLIKDLGAVHAFNDLTRSLTLAEAGDIYLRFVLQVSRLNGGFKLRLVGLYRENSGIIFFLLKTLDDHG